MEFRIADTFTDSLTRLTGDEQKAVKTTAFDLQMNPANPGMQFHRVDRAKDKSFWSARAGRDLRVIVHKTDANLLLCYAGHHDQAYQWAERRKLERHPKTGAAQLVELRECVRDVPVVQYVAKPAEPQEKATPFKDISDDDLLSFGVPREWIEDVHEADDDTILVLADRLPREAGEALLELATGGTPAPATVTTPEADPFDHPDAQRRFRTMTNRAELERALEYPWDKWIVFLHPAQRRLVEATYSGPARVSGSAGTGKTIVALHRAVYLARQHEDARVLLATFSEPLANALSARVRRLISSEPMLAERLEIQSITEAGLRLASARLGPLDISTAADIRKLLAEYSEPVEQSRFTQRFLWDEWADVVDAWQLSSWEEYRNVQRLGRKTRLAETQRQMLWGIFKQVRRQLHETGRTTLAEALAQAAGVMEKEANAPFDFVVVDEAQDMGVPELRFLAALGGKQANGLFFTGDLGQRIFQQPFSWKALGVDIRGRSHTLRINYRTSHQIRSQADRLLPGKLTDFDGNQESRSRTVSVFNGPSPVIQITASPEEESQAVGEWLKSLIAEDYRPHEIGVFVRSSSQIPRAKKAIQHAQLPCIELTERVNVRADHVSVGVMHLAKGLEFRAVAVMACDDEILPLQERIESVGDMADLEDVYNTERHLLYVACTRARDRLIVTGVEPPSEFLDDLTKSA